MIASHDAVTLAQFGPRAEAYVGSAVHASGPDLEELKLVAADAQPARALDLGCGGGHVSYCLAPHAREVIAVDLSSDMLSAVRATAKQRGLENVSTCQAPAESLPFADGTFDLVACRFSAHHWRDFDRGIAEARRVTRRGAQAVFIDVIAPARPLLDTHLQAVEVLRDTSHVRDYAISEWIATVERAGFVPQSMRRHRVRLDFTTWVERMRTPEPLVAAIRALQAAASQEVANYFGIEPDGSFNIDVLMLRVLA